MEAFLLSIGFLACVIAIVIAVIKAIETVWFFKEFRDKTNRMLERIEENLRNHKP